MTTHNKPSGLKMKDEHYTQLRDSLTTILPKLKSSEEPYKDGGLSPMRFRWDALRASGLRAGDSVGMRTLWPVYDYLNDEHIDSALRAIMAEFGLEWAAQK